MNIDQQIKETMLQIQQEADPNKLAALYDNLEEMFQFKAHLREKKLFDCYGSETDYQQKEYEV